MFQTQRSTRSLGLAAGCAAALALPHAAPAHPSQAQQAHDPAAALPGTGKGPAAFEALLARWDRMPAGPARDQLALEIDAVAGQRYATVSRLFWYTDLTAAQSAARSLERPILALRMLGRLDEDLSCANSRFFRTTLYANAEVSRFLRENFVLYWSSERPVPRVTIDYGDGRKIERTTTGNSAHYVLDAAGHVLDVLPGLYAPTVFQAELTKSARLAYRVRKLGDAQRAHAIAEHHRKELEAASARLAAVAGTEYIRGRGRLLGRDEVDAPAVARAQRATMSKAIVEMPDLGKIGIDAGSISPADLSAWAVIGQKAWGIYAAGTGGPEVAPRRRMFGRAAPAVPAAPIVLDAQSRALVTRVHDAGPVRATPAELGAMLARLEQSIVADTALNELRLRPQIRGMLADPTIAAASFEQINEWIYAGVFQTPRSDAWLGLLPRTDFTGLPGDGVVMP
ncbi:MAG TPA: hypothetical protein VNO30_47725 [Kofleriaceae bacterium]|nr:hypothetical protein [Kofleriaceae bacterium]